MIAVWWSRLGRQGKAVATIAAVAVIGSAAVWMSTAAWGAIAGTWRASPGPLRFTLSRDEEGYFIAVPDRAVAAAKLSADRGCAGLEKDARDANGADAKRTDLRLLVEGLSDNTVTITGIRALIVSRSAPRGGAAAICAGGGAVSPLRLTFDLDSVRPVALRMVGNEDEAHSAGPYFVAGGRVITIANHEVIPFQLAGVAKSHSVAWRIAIDATVGGQMRTFVIGDGHRPLRTTALADVTRYLPLYEWRWEMRPPRLTIARNPDELSKSYYLP
jgi:hypothetical protein